MCCENESIFEFSLLQIELMIFNCLRLTFVNMKPLRFSQLRYLATHDELLPMKKLNIISYAPVRFRNDIISKIETIVTVCSGYIDDFNFFRTSLLLCEYWALDNRTH